MAARPNLHESRSNSGSQNGSLGLAFLGVTCYV